MAFNAGAIESRLEMNLDPFLEGVRRARREAQALQRMRPRMTLGFDTDEFDRQRRRVEEELRRMSERSYRMRVGMDRSEFRRGAQEVERQMRGLNRSEANPRVGTKGMEAAGKLLEALKGGFLALAPVAIPVLVAITGATLIMGNAFITAGVAVGIFGLAAKNQIGVVTEAYSKLKAARKAYDKATTKEAKDAALVQQKKALEGLSTQQIRAVVALDKFKKAFSNFGHSAQGPILDIFISALRSVMNLLKAFEPVVRPVALRIKAFVVAFEEFSRGSGPKRFANYLAVQAPYAISVFIRSIRNVIIGIKNIFLAFSGAGQQGDFLATVERASEAFRRWTVSPGLQKFVQAFQVSGPKVAAALSAVALAISDIVVALGPVGGLILVAIVPLAQGLAWIAREAPWAVQALWALFAVMKALAIIKAVVAAVKALNLAMIAARLSTIYYVTALWSITLATKAWALAMVLASGAIKVVRFAWMLLNLAFTASPIGFIITLILAIGLALVLAYKKFAWFRNSVNAVFSWFMIAVKFVVNFVRDHWRLIIIFILGPLGLAIAIVTKYWTQIKNFVMGAVRFVVNFIRNHWRLIIAFIGGPLGLAIALVTKHWGTIKRITTSMIGFITSKIKAGMNAVKNAFSVGATAAGRAFDKIREATKKPVNFVIGTVYNNGIRKLWNTVTGWLHLSGLQLGEVPLLARGGPVPAAEVGWTNKATAVVGEGSKQHPEVVIPTDPKYRGRAQALWASAGKKIQMLERGGILGGGWDWVKKAAGKVKDVAKMGLDFLANPGKIFDTLAAKMVPSAAGIATSPWGQAMAAVPKLLLGEAKKSITGMAKLFNSGYGGDGTGVVKAALKYLGQGDDRGMDNDNIFTRQWGAPAGTPWCALFVSTAIKDANAGKKYAGYPSAAVVSYNSAMKHVPVGEGRAGDLATYGSNDHINIIIKKAGGAYDTVGGNQGPVVNRYVRGGQASVLRPMARGGILGNLGAALKMRNPDWRDAKNPLLAMMRKSFGVYDSGGDMHPGTTFGFNGTGKVESVVTDAWRNEVVARLDALQGRPTNIELTNNFRHPIDPYTASREIVNDLVEVLQ